MRYADDESTSAARAAFLAERAAEQRRIFKIGLTVVLAVVATLFCFQWWEVNSVTDIMVVQSPISGEITIYTDPGLKTVGFGHVTIYPKREEYIFGTPDSSRERPDTGPITVRFNDNAHADVSGSVSWEMPLDHDKVLALHTKFGSEEAVTTQVVAKALGNSMYMTGPLMSSTESASARRAELLQRIDDQMQHGIYTTDVHDEKIKDAVSGDDKTIKVVKLRDSANPEDFGYVRQEKSPIQEFGIRTFNLGLTEIKYDKAVEAQLREQQEAIAKVQSAIADAKKAEQDAITAELHGKALVAQSKAEQDAANAKDVALANMRKTVADLDAQTAESKKKALISEGEGEAKKRELIMAADGALAVRTEAWVKVNANYADALRGAKITPDVVMGGGSGDAGMNNPVVNLINLLMAKTAKDLSLDVEPSGQAKPKQ